MRRGLTRARSAAIALVAVVGTVAVLGSSDGAPPPVATPSTPPPTTPTTPSPPPSPPPPPPAPTRRSDGEGCDARDQCTSGHCCFTLLGSVCARACTFEAVGMPGAEERCVVDADCGRAQRCVTRATVGATVVRVCEDRSARSR